MKRYYFLKIIFVFCGHCKFDKPKLDLSHIGGWAKIANMQITTATLLLPPFATGKPVAFFYFTYP
jgi:hypothetical protein